MKKEQIHHMVNIHRARQVPPKTARLGTSPVMIFAFEEISPDTPSLRFLSHQALQSGRI